MSNLASYLTIKSEFHNNLKELQSLQAGYFQEDEMQNSLKCHIEFFILLSLGDTDGIDALNAKYDETTIIKEFHVAPSKVHGQGLFASKFIRKGELITFFPKHFVIKYDNNYTGKIILDKQLSESFARTYCTSYYMNHYRFNCPDGSKIIGIPDINDDPRYLGHMINDPATNFTSHDAYIEDVASKVNADFWYFTNDEIGIVSLRDIEPDDEIFVSYTYSYWTKCRVCAHEGKSKCGACRNVSYCSKTCQKADWSTHKLVCNKV